MFIFQCHFADRHLYTHIKKKQLFSTFLEVKLLFFSALIANCQRNNHFCGCKGTHILLFWQEFYLFRLQEDCIFMFF